MRGGVRAFCGAALLCALLAFAAVARAADVEAEAKAEATAQLNAELALEAAEQLQSQMAAYTAQGVASLQAAQVAAGVLSQAEADRGLVVARVVNTRITDRVTADVVARLADDGDDGSGYDEAFAKQASDYSAAAYYDGDPASALNYQANANNFELGAKVSAPYYGGDVSAYTGIDKNRNLIVVGYEGTSNGPKQLAAEGVLGFGRDVPGCPGCKTTQYFGAAQDKLYPQISASVRDLQKKCPTCKVLVTGHSLGGAMAQNGAYQMMKDGTLKTAPTFYTFGQPKTGNPAYNAEFNKLIPNAYRVTHDTDLVPTVGARAKGTNIGTEISYNDAMTSYTKCGGAGCGNKLKSELIKDVKQNAADTFGKPLPTWDQVFSHPFKSAGDVLSRPVDFVKKEVGDVKADVTNSVDQHVKYFGKDLGSEFDSQDPQIKAYQAAQDAKAKQDPAAADAQQQQTRGMPQPLMAMPPGFDGADKDPAAQDKDAKDKPKPALGAAAPGADGKGAKEEKLEDTPSTTPDAVKQLLADDKAKGKAKDKKKSQKQPAKAKAKAKAKGQDKKQPKAKKQKQKANKKQPKKQPKKQAKKQAKKPAKKQQKKRPAKKPKAKKSAAKKPKRAPKKRAPKKQKRSRAPKRRAPKRAPKRRARAPKRRAPKRRAPKRRAPKRRAPQRRPTPRGSR